jgi:hypothetical protein
MYASMSNQWAFGFGYRRSTIYGSNRHMLWLDLGYKTLAWSWNKNPEKP